MKICILTLNTTFKDDRLFYKLGKSLSKIADISIINPSFQNEGSNPKHIGIQKSIINRKKRSEWYIQQLTILEPDIIIINHPFLIPLASIFKKQAKTKIIYDPAEDWGNMVKELSSFHWLKNWGTLFYIKWIESIYAKSIDLVITTDNWLETFYSKKFKTVQLFNYPNYSLFNEHLSKCNNYSLVYHGQLIKERGVFDLIHATHILVNQFPKIELNLIGWFTKNKEEIEAKQLVKSLNISKHVNFINLVEHTKIPKLLSQNTIGVVPLQNIKKFQHNMPTKVFEYIACGLHVVSSNLKPTMELKNSKKWASFYDADNVKSLTKSISGVLNNESTLNIIFEKEFHWEAQEHSLLQTVKRLTT